MGKKEKKREKAENIEGLENGGSESNEKRSKKKRKNINTIEEQQTDDVPSTTEIPTITIALPGSIVDNTQSLELATRLAGQVARAATIFRIDEVVIFDNKEDSSSEITDNDSGDNESGASFLMRILRYLETPQYLRKSLFRMHSSLRFVGLLPPLDAPHHLRKHEWASYREGLFYLFLRLSWANDGLHLIAELQVVIFKVSEAPISTIAICYKSARGIYFSDPKIVNSEVCGLALPEEPRTLILTFKSLQTFGIAREKLNQGSAGTLVDVGLSKNITVDQVLEPGTRVTVEMGTNRNLEGGPRKVVPSSRPRDEGMYWGYSLRYAPNISSVFKNCPYEGGYDHQIGTSEHGSVISSSKLTLPSFKHLLIAFGGLAGLEECVEEDASLKGKNVRDIFDSYLNTCPHQGSRTIRTEEAILISLQYFQEPISRVSQKYERRTQ